MNRVKWIVVGLCLLGLAYMLTAGKTKAKAPAEQPTPTVQQDSTPLSSLALPDQVLIAQAEQAQNPLVILLTSLHKAGKGKVSGETHMLCDEQETLYLFTPDPRQEKHAAQSERATLQVDGKEQQMTFMTQQLSGELRIVKSITASHREGPKRRLREEDTSDNDETLREAALKRTLQGQTPRSTAAPAQLR